MVHTICLSANDSCNTTICDSIYIEGPYPYFTATINGYTVSFTNNSTGVQNYSWTFGDGTSNTNFEPTHTYTTSGVKNVCLFGIDSCMTEVYCDMIVISNPQALSSSVQMDMQFYPNPTKDFLFLEAHNLTENNGKIFLYNLLGEVILEKELIVTQGNIKEKIDLRDIPIGMYFLSFQSAHNYHLQKVMKE